MNATTHGVRLGLERGLREFRHTLGSSDQVYNLVISVGFLIVLWFQRDSNVEGSGITLAALTLPSMLGMGMVFGSLVGPAAQLAVNREDGTLLRAKAVPNGVVGYLVGRVVQTALDNVFSLLIILVPGLFLVNVLANAGVAGLLGLFAVLALGAASMLPWGAVIGSITRSPSGAIGLSMLPMMALGGISGIFYPITALPVWLQWLAQVFPAYWAAHGSRAALLPDSAAAAEIGGSWRILEMVGVLGVWAVVGFLLAPAILRRMARRESGADMEQRRQAVLQRMP